MQIVGRTIFQNSKRGEMKEPIKPIPLIEYLNEQIEEYDMVLDIGCGTKVIANELQCGGVTTLDIWQPFKPDIWCNLMTVPELPCADNSFDVILLIDVIEHLTKDRGFMVLKEAKRITTKYIFILTPLWWDPNLDFITDTESPYFNNDFNKHLSLWNVSDFSDFERITSIPMFKDYFFGVWRKK